MSNKRTVSGYVMPPAMDAVKGALARATIVDPGSQLIFVTGMVALSESGEVLHPYDTESQCREIFQEMRSLLQELGAGLADVVRITVYMRDLSDVKATLSVRQEFWPDNPPSSTTIGVSQLGMPTDSLRLEIDAIAAVAR